MFIYVVTNRINGKQYVGQTGLTVEHRWKAHLANARRRDPGCRAFYSAIRKYGPDAFSIQSFALPADATQELLDRVERRVIALLNTRRPHGYNIKVGGNGGPHHEETKARIAAAHMGIRPSEETRAKLRAAHIGKPSPKKGIKTGPLAPETRAKLSKAHKGRVFTPEWRAKISAAKRGFRHSPETKALIGEKGKGRPSPTKGKPRSEESKAKQRAAMLGRKRAPFTEEHRARISAAKKGKPRPELKGVKLSPEHRAKIAEAARRDWDRRRQKAAKVVDDSRV